MRRGANFLLKEIEWRVRDRGDGDVRRALFDGVIAVEAGDLFNEIDLFLDVVAVGGNFEMEEIFAIAF